MFGLGVTELLIGIALFLLAEVAVFWAATALGDVTPMSWVKLFLVVVVVSAMIGGVIGLVVWFSGATLSSALSPEHRLLAVFLAAVSLATLWAVPAVLYVPLLSLSIPKSMLIAVFQWLLRGFLYLLIIAVVMVVLAVIQIYRGTDVRTQLPGSPPVLGRSL